jgi:hypothetical protein
MRTILVVRNERFSRQVNPELMEAATAEVLRSAILAGDVVLVPANSGVLPLAAVIARGLLHTPSPDDERGRQSDGLPHPGRLPQPGQFIAFKDESEIEAMLPLRRAYLGRFRGESPLETDVAPLSDLLQRFLPEAAIVLTPDPIASEALQVHGLRPMVYYFRSLLGARIDMAVRQFRSVAASLIDLEEDWSDERDRDPESDRSDDEGLEPFVPFSVMLQEALSRR